MYLSIREGRFGCAHVLVKFLHTKGFFRHAQHRKKSDVRKCFLLLTSIPDLLSSKLALKNGGKFLLIIILGHVITSVIFMFHFRKDCD